MQALGYKPGTPGMSPSELWPLASLLSFIRSKSSSQAPSDGAGRSAPAFKRSIFFFGKAIKRENHSSRKPPLHVHGLSLHVNLPGD